MKNRCSLTSWKTLEWVEEVNLKNLTLEKPSEAPALNPRKKIYVIKQ